MGKNTRSEIQFRSAMDTAARILAGRGHTSSELARKLKNRRIKPDIVAQVVAECERLNYIDDADTAQLYLQELKRKGYGRRYARSAMRKKGIDTGTIESCLENGYPHSEEIDSAAAMAQKKQATFNREKDPRKRKSKIYRYLYNRGYSPDTITSVLSGIVKGN